MGLTRGGTAEVGSVLRGTSGRDGAETVQLLFTLGSAGFFRRGQLQWWGFSGIATFGHPPHLKCLIEDEERFDIAIVGAPFDTAVSYRPGQQTTPQTVVDQGPDLNISLGARFGPRAIRDASCRHLPSRGFNTQTGVNPYMSWARILDCGDIPITPFDNDLAVRQMNDALLELGTRSTNSSQSSQGKGSLTMPKLLILGGDHSVSLPSLRALNKIYSEPIAVVHFDAHLDTLHPSSYPSEWSSPQTEFTHGSMFWQASNEGLVLSGSSVHAGLRTRLTGSGWDDYARDDEQGYLRTGDIDDIGVDGIVREVMERVGTEALVYLSVDIDVLDPGIAQGTGAPEAGGWTMRELSRVLRGLNKLNVVGADIVEVAPAYDDKGEGTALAAAQVAYEIISIWVQSSAPQSGTASSTEDVKTEL
ncbi:MAG: hypothetical protein Q9172_005794 [Xanthocarpia lactea]